MFRERDVDNAFERSMSTLVHATQDAQTLEIELNNMRESPPYSVCGHNVLYASLDEPTHSSYRPLYADLLRVLLGVCAFHAKTRPQQSRLMGYICTDAFFSTIEECVRHNRYEFSESGCLERIKRTLTDLLPHFAEKIGLMEFPQYTSGY